MYNVDSSARGLPQILKNMLSKETTPRETKTLPLHWLTDHSIYIFLNLTVHESPLKYQRISSGKSPSKGLTTPDWSWPEDRSPAWLLPGLELGGPAHPPQAV